MGLVTRTTGMAGRLATGMAGRACSFTRLAWLEGEKCDRMMPAGRH